MARQKNIYVKALWVTNDVLKINIKTDTFIGNLKFINYVN